MAEFGIASVWHVSVCVINPHRHRHGDRQTGVAVHECNQLFRASVTSAAIIYKEAFTPTHQEY